MAFHDISTRFWLFTKPATPQAIPPQDGCSRTRSDTQTTEVDCTTEPREPEWQGQWRVLKYF